MAGKIFHLGKQRRLVPLEETAYDSEDLLQALLADYPDLLAGDQIDAGANELLAVCWQHQGGVT